MKDFVYIETEDGSLSCRDSDSGELYHNRAGAYLEALKDYAEPACLSLTPGQRSIKVLDVCFGLGYNTLAMLQVATRPDASGAQWERQPLGRFDEPLLQSITVLAIDVDERVCTAVAKILQQDCFSELRQRFPKVKYGVGTIDFTNGSTQIQVQIDIADFRARLLELTVQNEEFDVIFHDPFSPSKMPDLWTLDIFKCYYQLLKRRTGLIFTYSSASRVRGALAQSGFQIYRTPAVGGMRGGTCGAIGTVTNNAALIPLTKKE